MICGCTKIVHLIAPVLARQPMWRGRKRTGPMSLNGMTRWWAMRVRIITKTSSSPAFSASSTSTKTQNTKLKTQNFRTENSKLETRNSKLKILDLACGQGVLSRKLAQLQCEVVGLDAAAPLIEAARRRNESDRLPIRYAVADATKLLDDNGNGNPAVEIAPNSLDAITLILAIQNITPLSPVWQACRELLKPGGALIVVMMHPCFRIPKQSDWLWQDVSVGGGVGAQSRIIRQYLSSVQVDIQTHPGLAAHGKDAASTPHFHRPLQAYINTLGNAGLLIDHIEEWISHKSSQPGPRKVALDRARKEIPMFLALRRGRFEQAAACSAAAGIGVTSAHSR